MKLISMTAFVLEDEKKTNWNSYNLIVAYAKFLKQPLELWMFTPCELVGNEFANWQPMQEPNEKKYFELIEIKQGKEVFKKHTNLIEDEIRQYQQAKERCLFDNFKFIDAINYHILRERTVEYLADFGTINLTPTAIKQLGLE